MVLMRIVGNDPSLDADCGDEYDAAVDGKYDVALQCAAIAHVKFDQTALVNTFSVTNKQTGSRRTCAAVRRTRIVCRGVAVRARVQHDLSSITMPFASCQFEPILQPGWLHGRHCLPKLKLDEPCAQVRGNRRVCSTGG